MTQNIKAELLTETELLFDGELSIRRVAELKERLQQAIEQSETVRVDLSQVEKIDLGALQLFCAAYRTAAGSKCSLRLIGPLFDSVSKVVADAGLSSLIDCTLDDRG